MKITLYHDLFVEQNACCMAHESYLRNSLFPYESSKIVTHTKKECNDKISSSAIKQMLRHLHPNDNNNIRMILVPIWLDVFVYCVFMPYLRCIQSFFKLHIVSMLLFPLFNATLDVICKCEYKIEYETEIEKEEKIMKNNRIAIDRVMK